MALLRPDGTPADTEPSPQTQDQPPAEPQAPARVTTAFLVYQLPNGQWVASGDIFTPVVPMRQVVPDDLIGACANISAQTIAQMSAPRTAQLTVATLKATIQQEQAHRLTPAEAAAVAASGR